MRFCSRRLPQSWPDEATAERGAWRMLTSCRSLDVRIRPMSNSPPLVYRSNPKLLRVRWRLALFRPAWLLRWSLQWRQVRPLLDADADRADLESRLIKLLLKDRAPVHPFAGNGGSCAKRTLRFIQRLLGEREDHNRRVASAAKKAGNDTRGGRDKLLIADRIADYAAADRSTRVEFV
jgi:hypothetical protein